jgi:hypothetical protein
MLYGFTDEGKTPVFLRAAKTVYLVCLIYLTPITARFLGEIDATAVYRQAIPLLPGSEIQEIGEIHKFPAFTFSP